MEKIDEKRQDEIIKRNAIFSIFSKGLEYFITFFSTPILLTYLGNYKYGVYTTTLSLISWIYYFDFGVGSGLRNKVSEAIVKNDHELARNSVNIAYILTSIISIILFLLVLILSIFLDFDRVLNAKLVDENLNLIILIAICLSCFNFILSLSTNILFSLQMSGLVSGLGILSKVLMLGALLIFSFLKLQAMIIIVIIEGIIQLIKNVIATLYITKKNKLLLPNFKKIEYRYARGILGFGVQIFLMQIAALVLNLTDNIIIMKFFGAMYVTPYSMCHKYYMIINAFFVSAIAPLWTTFTNAYTLRDVRYIKNVFIKTLILYLFTLAGIIIAIFGFRPFMKLYLGQELEYQTGIVLLVAIYYALLIFSHIFSSFVHGISKVRLTSVACIIGAIINIPSSIFMAVYLEWRLNGIIMGSIISLLISTTAYIYTTIKEIKILEGEKE